MKKILLFLGVALLSMSIYAAPVTSVQKFTKSTLAVQAKGTQFEASHVEKALVPQVREAIPETAIKSAKYFVFDLSKIVKQDSIQQDSIPQDTIPQDSIPQDSIPQDSIPQDSIPQDSIPQDSIPQDSIPMDSVVTTSIVMQEAGYGIVKATITPGTGTDSLYYQVAILNEKANALAYAAFFPLATVDKYFSTSYDILYAALSGQSYAKLVDTSIKNVYLPKGKYFYAILGFPLTADGKSVDTSGDPSDVVIAPFEITMDGSEYAIKNINVEVGANNKLNVSWETNTTPVPEGAAYQVRVYNYPDNEKVADSGYELESMSWTTPDSVQLPNDATYAVIVNIWSASGFALGKPASKTFTLGTDPNAPTDLAVVVDDETMKATFTWTNTLGGKYDGKTVYNQVDIVDEEGNIYIFDNGYNNTSLATATSEPLPVGKYTWSIAPFYVDDDDEWIYLTVVNGPDFEVKDVVAPVINSVAIAQLSDTVVYLSIEVTDNAIEVTAADLKFNVSGDITLENASLEENGTLKLDSLESTKKYQIQIKAVDPSGNISEAYEFEFTPIKDEEAPKNLTAEIAEENIFDKYVIINVSAEDDKATAEQLVYIITFANGNVIEMNAKDGQLLIEGLTPETAYEITVSVKDLGGNVCENTVKLQFTTVPLIPIEITGFTSFQGHYYTKYKAYDMVVFNGDDETDDGSMMELVFYLQNKAKVANVYTPNSRTAKLGGIYYSKADKTDVKITATSLDIKFVFAVVSEGVQISAYEFTFEGTGDDGNLYVYHDIITGLFYEDTWQNWITVTDTFVDTEAPYLWVSEDYPAEVDGTNVGIMFGAYDGPWYSAISYCNEIYSEITDLVLEIQDKNGIVLASQAAGSIVNTPTMDEDGNYYFTATLKGLEPETEYTVYIYAKDEAGNVADKIAVSFKTGEKSEEGIENVNGNIKAYKLIRDGQMIIKRGDKEFNVIGSQL